MNQGNCTNSKKGLIAKCRACNERPAIIKCYDCAKGDDNPGSAFVRYCWPCDNKKHQNSTFSQLKHRKEMIPYNEMFAGESAGNMANLPPTNGSNGITKAKNPGTEPRGRQEMKQSGMRDERLTTEGKQPSSSVAGRDMYQTLTEQQSEQNEKFSLRVENSVTENTEVVNNSMSLMKYITNPSQRKHSQPPHAHHNNNTDTSQMQAAPRGSSSNHKEKDDFAMSNSVNLSFKGAGGAGGLVSSHTLNKKRQTTFISEYLKGFDPDTIGLPEREAALAQQESAKADPQGYLLGRTRPVVDDWNSRAVRQKTEEMNGPVSKTPDRLPYRPPRDGRTNPLEIRQSVDHPMSSGPCEPEPFISQTINVERVKTPLNYATKQVDDGAVSHAYPHKDLDAVNNSVSQQATPGEIVRRGGPLNAKPVEMEELSANATAPEVRRKLTDVQKALDEQIKKNWELEDELVKLKMVHRKEIGRVKDELTNKEREWNKRQEDYESRLAKLEKLLDDGSLGQVAASAQASRSRGQTGENSIAGGYSRGKANGLRERYLVEENTQIDA